MKRVDWYKCIALFWGSRPGGGSVWHSIRRCKKTRPLSRWRAACTHDVEHVALLIPAEKFLETLMAGRPSRDIVVPGAAVADVVDLDK